MAGVKAVVHLIGIITETSRMTYEQAHTEATRNVLAAAKHAGVTRWVQMSAIGTRPHARSRYHQTKWAAEELVRASGMDWTILRPSLIYGYDQDDRLLNLFRRVLSPPVGAFTLFSFGLINGGAPFIQPVSVREVAHCFALAPATPAALGQTIDLVGPVAMSWREMIFKVLGALKKRGVYQEVPGLLILRGLLWLAIVLVAAVVLVKLDRFHPDIPAGWPALLLLLVLAAGICSTTSQPSSRAPFAPAKSSRCRARTTSAIPVRPRKFSATRRRLSIRAWPIVTRRREGMGDVSAFLPRHCYKHVTNPRGACLAQGSALLFPPR